VRSKERQALFFLPAELVSVVLCPLSVVGRIKLGMINLEKKLRDGYWYIDNVLFD
jgi:hypothetical protein